MQTETDASGESGAHVVIVGGGIAGLSAAWYLQQEATRQSIPVRYTLLETSERWGGKIRSERIEGVGGGPTIIEAGPDSFLTRKPWALSLARELGLDDHLKYLDARGLRTYTLLRGRLVPLPAGWNLLAPSQWTPFLQSLLFSLRGKARICLEPLIPPRRDDADESLGQFVRRRLGAEALGRVAEPLMAGVYNAPADEQSLRATFPQFAVLEREHGSVIRGLRAIRQKSATGDTPPFVSLDAGAEALVQQLVTRLDGDLRLRSEVSGVAQNADDGYDVRLRDGAQLHADAIILACPAFVSARILRESVPNAADLLAGIGSSGIGSAYLGYRRGDVPHPLDGAGVVIPTSEGRRIDGVTWVSSKWPARAPQDLALLRVFFGGPATREALDLDDAALLALVRGEMAAILGVQAAPLFQRVFRVRDGYPRYTVGHLERVEAIERALPAGLYVTGASYRGVGVPDCVRQGQEAASHVLSELAPLTHTGVQSVTDARQGRSA
ncbi:MAG TPA: protoporphyrinogen oxidase [Ktedonobacterales bacterium]